MRCGHAVDARDLQRVERAIDEQQPTVVERKEAGVVGHGDVR
jgi:hypothetical protein